MSGRWRQLQPDRRRESRLSPARRGVGDRSASSRRRVRLLAAASVERVGGARLFALLRRRRFFVVIASSRRRLDAKGGSGERRVLDECRVDASARRR